MMPLLLLAWYVLFVFAHNVRISNRNSTDILDYANRDHLFVR